MSASHEHRRLSPVRACVLLIVVYLTVCAALFAEEKPTVPSEWSRLFPTLFGEQKALFAEEKSPAPSELSASSSTLFAETKLPVRSDWNHSVAPVDDNRGRTQRTQRIQRAGGGDRVQAFYDSLDGLKVQQKQEEGRKARDAQRLASRRFSHTGHQHRR